MMLDEDPLRRADELLFGSGEGSPNPIAAFDAYEEAAAEGSVAAAMRAAVLAGLGVGCEQNWGAALDHLARAAIAGDRPARRQILLLSGQREPTGKGPAAWRRMRAEIDLDEWLTPPKAQPVSRSPAIVMLPGFAPRAVCRWLIARSADRLEQSVINNSQTGEVIVHPTRTARNFIFNLLTTDMVMVVMQERLARACGQPVLHHEAPSVLSYTVGQEFRQHFDFVELPTFAHELAILGQRVLTCLTYLNDDYDAGETHFPRLGLRLRGKMGDALLFCNVTQTREPDLLTLHAGLPPTRGRKWLLSQWVRDRVQPIL
jgi:prolyl 4-hydroxylase